MSFDPPRQCKYTSPSGVVSVLGFDSLERDGAKKLAVNEPPQQNRAEVQDLGNSGIRFPLTVYINGPTYQADADAFFAALSEHYDRDTPATLAHPRWGDVLVCPTTWTQVEQFVEGMGEAVFTLEFIRIDREALFPATGNDAGAQLQADNDAAAASAQAGYGANGVPTTPADVANVTAKSGNLLSNIGSSLRGMASAASDLGAQFQADLDSALGAVDDLVADPILLAQTVMSLARAPANAVIAIGDKVTEYQNMIANIGLSTANSYAEAELMLLGLGAAAAGASDSTLTGDLDTRTAAVDVADGLDDMQTAIQDQIEAAEALGWLPDADTVANIMQMLSRCRARMLQASFDLPTERHYITSGPIDPISLIKQLKGTFTEADLDQAIKDNDLSDEEFFLLPTNFNWVWYA